MAVKLFLACSLFGLAGAFAQSDVVSLPEVTVDLPLRHASASQQVTVLNDSVVWYNRGSLATLLEYQSPFSVRQNGYGMVASVSLRGTTAQQTAVVWNGININSQLNGQTDFSTLSAADYLSVAGRSGGGSVMYGSSAIGGTVHLQNDVAPIQGIAHLMMLRAGSFDTRDILYRINAGGARISGMMSAAVTSSENDYPRPDGTRNQNGAFTNVGINGSWRYRFNQRHSLQFYNRLYTDNRQFSLIDPHETPTHYRNLNSANQLVYTASANKFTTNLRIAHLAEGYRFFASPHTEDPEKAEAQTWLGRIETAWKNHRGLWVQVSAEHNQSRASGTNIDEASRDITAFAALVNHRIARRVTYEVGLRQEVTTSYQSPLLFSGGVTVDVTASWKLRANGSRNFRIPTFNDLYWSNGGNTHLRPETSYQAEIGQEFTGKLGTLKMTAFYIDIDDMIHWVPGAGASWHARNTREVTSRGVEAEWSGSWKIGIAGVSARGTYAFTRSENGATGNQLVYAPEHRGNASISVSIRRWSGWMQGVFCGETHTRSDNNRRYALDPYAVVHIGMQYRISEGFRMGAQIFNTGDQAYQTMEGRDMPLRHYQLFINLTL